MIRKLIDLAREEKLRPGDVVEVHIEPDVDPSEAGLHWEDGTMTVAQFRRRWANCFGPEDMQGDAGDRFIRAQRDGRCGWLGVVHDHGALLVAVPLSEVPA